VEKKIKHSPQNTAHIKTYNFYLKVVSMWWIWK